MPLICPKCGKIYKKINDRSRNHIINCPEATLCGCGCLRYAKPGRQYIYHHNRKGKPSPLKGTGKPKSPPQPCWCGCLEMTKPGNRYIIGHNGRGRQQPTEEIEGRRQSLLKYWKELPLEQSIIKKALRGQKISTTKQTLEGKEVTRLASLKGKDQMIAKLKGHVPSNKMDDKDKTITHCLQCGAQMLLRPCHITNKKFCSIPCKVKYRTGRPMENWNPNSHLKNYQSSRGICGRYKGVLFRSSLELSFLVQADKMGDCVQAEPFIIPLSDYLSPVDQEVFNLQKQKRYIPDYLLNDTTIVELKPECCFDLEHRDFAITIAKSIALSNYCKEKGLSPLILTDSDMGELVLTNQQIRDIPTQNIEFFKEKHRERYLSKMDV